MTAVAGGDTHPAFRVETEQGTLFVKTRAVAPDQFPGEAQALEAMRASGTSLRIPRVVKATDALLALEWLESGEGRDAEARLGVGLAQLHSAQAEQFGFDVQTYCGPTSQPNGWCRDFLTFYRHQRLAVVLFHAHLRGALSDAERAMGERLLDRLSSLLPEEMGPPRLIHGDLWSGNVLQTAAGPALVDPASSYSHPEAELGMMTLFGGFSARTLAAYREALPPLAGWEERQPIFQLYHLLNHAAIFGEGYGRKAMQVVMRFL